MFRSCHNWNLGGRYYCPGNQTSLPSRHRAVPRRVVAFSHYTNDFILRPCRCSMDRGLCCCGIGFGRMDHSCRYAPGTHFIRPLPSLIAFQQFLFNGCGADILWSLAFSSSKLYPGTSSFVTNDDDEGHYPVSCAFRYQCLRICSCHEETVLAVYICAEF